MQLLQIASAASLFEHWNSMQQQLSQLYSSAIHGHVMVSCAADAVECTEDLLKIY